MEAEQNHIGLLEAVSRVPKQHRAGFIGWTLYYQSFDDDTITILLQGNDLKRRGVCFYDGGGSWQPGRYALYVQRFHEQNLVPLRSSHRKWIIRQPVRRLGCGSISDPLAPLRL